MLMLTPPNLQMAANAVLTAPVLYMMKTPDEVDALIKTGLVESEATLAASKLAKMCHRVCLAGHARFH